MLSATDYKTITSQQIFVFIGYFRTAKGCRDSSGGSGLTQLEGFVQRTHTQLEVLFVDDD